MKRSMFMRSAIGALAGAYRPAATVSGVLGPSPDLGDLSVRSFGAMGDGVTDDTAAFQRWAAALNTGGGVGYLPAGTYVLKSGIVFSHSKITICGAGPSSVIAATITANTYVFAALADSTIFRDFAVTGSHPGLRFDNGATAMHSCQLLNVTVSGATVNNNHGFAAGFFCVNNTGLTVERCVFSGNGSATGENHADIACNFGTFQITNSRITGNRCLSTLVNSNIICFDPINVLVEGNECTGAIVSPVSGGRQGYGIGLYNNASHAYNALIGHCRIVANSVRSVGGSGIYVQSIHHTIIAGNTVDGTGADQSDVTLSVGGISLDSGTGSCPVVCTGNTVLNSHKDGITISGIIGFAVSGNLVDRTTGNGIGVRGAAADGVIADNTVLNTAKAGIGMWSDAVAVRVSVRGNRVRTLTGGGSSRGISATRSTDSWKVHDNDVSDVGGGTPYSIVGTTATFDRNSTDGVATTAAPTPVLATGAGHTVDDVIAVLQRLGGLRQS